jgi:hypothetical protein
MFYQKLICFYHGTNHQIDEENRTLYLDHRMSRSLRFDQAKVHGNIDIIPPNWQLEFHVHTNASLLAVGAMLAHNPTRLYDQLIIYVFKLLNKLEHNYTTTKR